MHIAFVECRDKTRLLSAAAAQLSARRVSWLVQNSSFVQDDMDHAYVIPYPTKGRLASFNAHLNSDEIDLLTHAINLDRYFTDEHGIPRVCTWYFCQVKEWLQKERPDVVIGEASTFHSYLAAVLCERMGIPFLNPSSSRYPAKRFSFFVGERLAPVGGDTSSIDKNEIESTVESIRMGTKLPDYMKKSSSGWVSGMYRLELLKAWVMGEKYETRTPLNTLRDSVKRKQLRSAWDKASHAEPPQFHSNECIRILYPLQRQPEFNLDIWGKDHRDQTRTVQNLAKNANTQVVIKPNPKSFREISPQLVTLLNQNNIVGIRHEVMMPQIEQQCDLVVTVTGTIAIERLLRGRAVAILSNDYSEWLGIPSFQSLGCSLTGLDQSAVTRLEEVQQQINGHELIYRLAQSSYPGLIAEPHLAPAVLTPENVRQIARAIESVAALLLTK